MTGAAALADLLLPAIRGWQADAAPRLLTVGICGAQGSGKSTLVTALAVRLEGEGLRTAILSLDDLYLTKAQRRHLARKAHPLFAVRGVPGTHDVALGVATIAALDSGEPASFPRFDKGADDRVLEHDWPRAPANTQVLLFEGWCLGARPQPQVDLARPVNAIEAAEDPDAVWRTHANAALAGPYAGLWRKLDRLIFLAAPGWEVIAKWREQQEAELRARSPGAMSREDVVRFVQHYERLTRWILEEMPERADVTVRLGEVREVLSLSPPLPDRAP